MCYLAEFVPQTKSWQRDCGRTLAEDRFYAAVHEDGQTSLHILGDYSQLAKPAFLFYISGTQSQPSCESCREVLQMFDRI